MYIQQIILLLTTLCKQMRKQWLALPFILLFPLFLLAITAYLVFAIITPNTDEPIHIAIVDEDKSEETTLLTMLLSEGEALGNIKAQPLSQKKASEQLQANELAAYLVFPKHFTGKLYNGERAKITIVGNSNFTAEAMLVSEFTTAITDYINTAQANLLVINRYAKTTAMPKAERQEMLFSEFQRYFTFILAKGIYMKNNVVENPATAQPILYYAIGITLALYIIWLFLLYQFFQHENPSAIQLRMRLYGIRLWQPLLARGILALLIAWLLISASILLAEPFSSFAIIASDKLKILFILALVGLHSVANLITLEVLIHNKKMIMLAQTLYCLAIILLSGAIIPINYLPSLLAKLASLLFSAMAFSNFLDMLFLDKLFINTTPLLISTMLSLVLCGIVFFIREREN